MFIFKKPFITSFFACLMVSIAVFLSKHYEVSIEKHEINAAHSVNAVIGDISYKATYGVWPDASTPEVKRIVTHLKYVRSKLAAKDVSYLPLWKQQKRELHLERLEDYIRQREFPVNNAFPNQRRPIFIDSEGRICAVGYLIEQSLGREAAEAINKKYQYEYVLNMDSELLEDWAYKNGFTLRELAMIQPAYGPQNPFVEKDDPEINQAAEAVLIGSTVGLSLVNGYLGATNAAKAIPASLGIALGASTLTLGLTNHANFSTADIIAGALSAAAGSWALYKLLGEREPVNNLNIAPIANTKFKHNIGIRLNYRF